ncbi:hypothetical protein [Aquimarina sp. 2201CG5-10]|uniref:hypothetical protein n=1 Tax=Aquimarina callyspongiae TaxID=3098150 RepID=UPI002AB529A6|nr:hypothetical protein [Aquimarina sp. 2201CG5-10]MDY8138415.1 hypothetical protein [Aquimarina sp. 2201CG5-10]
MKKITLFLACLLVSISSFGQIKKVETVNKELIGKVSNLGWFLVSIHKSENTYYVTYQDAKYNDIKDHKFFSFEDIDHAFDTLYHTILEGFKTPQEEPVILEIPSGYVWLDYSKELGVVLFRFGYSITKNGEMIWYSNWLTKRKVNKVFGKKQNNIN